MAGPSLDTATAQPVLVTGAGGFIGSHLVRRLIGRGRRVTCLVRGGSRLEELRSAGAEIVTGDVTDRAGVARVIAESRAGVVFHLAGLVRAIRAGDFERVNAGGVENVAAACAGCGTPPVLVVVSSLAAAGPCEAGSLRVESDTPSPVSNYGRSKLAGEWAAAKYAGRVPISIVRPPIVFGPADLGVLEMFKPIARSGIHVVPGRGEARFSLVHVDDLVEGLLLVAEKGERLSRDGSPGQGVYFMAGEDHPTYAQLGEAIATALGKTPPTVIRLPGPLMRLLGIGGDVISRVRHRPGWISRDKITEALAGPWTCSSDKAREHMGWSPTVPLADRLRETAEWYRGAGWL